MKYLTLGIHYPKPEHKQDLLDATQKIADVARAQPGLVETGAWIDADNDRIVVMSLWDSVDAATAARPKLAPLVAGLPFDKWERKPNERMVKLTRAV